MSSKQTPGDSAARKTAAPLFGKQSSKDILDDASGSSAKSPYAAARPQPSAARAGVQSEHATFLLLVIERHLFALPCMFPTAALNSPRLLSKSLYHFTPLHRQPNLPQLRRLLPSQFRRRRPPAPQNLPQPSPPPQTHPKRLRPELQHEQNQRLHPHPHLLILAPLLALPWKTSAAATT